MSKAHILEQFGGKTSRAEDMSIEERGAVQGAQARMRARDLAAAHDWHRFEPHELVRPAGKKNRDYVADPSSGRLYRAVPFQEDVLTGIAAAEIDAYFETRAGGVVYLVATKRGEPQTLADLDAERADQRRRREEAAKAERVKIAALPRRAVTAAELAELPNPPTLAEAVRRIEKAGGVVENRDGELVVELAPKAPHRGPAIAGCRVLFAATPAVLQALEAGGAESLAERLPDVHPRAGGGVT